MNHKILNKLERKFGRFAIPNLMMIVIFGMALVFLIDTFINPEYTFNLSSLIMFSREDILAGQVWRILTFVFLPPSYSIIFIAFTLYFYYLIGTALESQWGSFRFNVYYFTGIIGSIIVGLITGFATNDYLNMTLFLAFAMLFPNFEVMLFFFIPVKIKWLAWLDSALMFVSFLFSSWPQRFALLVAFANFLFFFGPELLYHGKMIARRIGLKFKKKKYTPNEHKQNWKNHWWDDHNNNPFR